MSLIQENLKGEQCVHVDLHHLVASRTSAGEVGEVLHPQDQLLNAHNCFQGTVVIGVAESSGTNKVIK